MASSVLRASSRANPYVCARCTWRQSTALHTPARSWLGEKHMIKQDRAQEEWEVKAERIRNGEEKSMLAILEERGLVHQLTGSRKQLEALLTDKRIGAYVGIDPTAPSIHLGHMLPLMSLFWLYVHGYHTVTLLGGATAKIGDPTGRLATRTKFHSSVQTENMVKMHYQLKTLWTNVEKYGEKHGYKWEWSWKRALRNNADWMNKLKFLEIIQTLGPGMRMGAMLARDTVKNKMEKGDGMSWAEFTYPLMQAWDWWHMYQSLKVSMQIGGSDQYGNITAGIDAIKHLAANHPAPEVRAASTDVPVGMTVPLLTTSSGEKFGKSAGNAIWLDPEMTSTFDLYGYLLKTPDADVARLLKMLTFMPLAEIDKVMAEHELETSKRTAQHKLASEFVEMVYGRVVAVKTANEHALLFGRPLEKVPNEPDNVSITNRPSPSMTLPRAFILTKSIGKLLYAAGLVDSATEGHKLVTNGGLYIGGQPSGAKGPMEDSALRFTRISNWRIEDTARFLIDNRLLILRRGANNIRVIEVVDDAAYEQSGKTFPGYEAKQIESDLQKVEDGKKAHEEKQRASERPILADEWYDGAHRSYEEDKSEHGGLREHRKTENLAVTRRIEMVHMGLAEGQGKTAMPDGQKTVAPRHEGTNRAAGGTAPNLDIQKEAAHIEED